MNIISIGEVLWDVLASAEHLGGAPFNFATHLNNLGHRVFFVSAVGKDPRGDRALGLMSNMGLDTTYVRRLEQQTTGIVTVKLDSQGQPHFTIHRPAAYDYPELSPAELAKLASQSPDWIYFGTLLQMSAQARRLTIRVLDSNPGALRFYDVNLRANCYDAAVVNDLMSRANVVKLNEYEVEEISRLAGREHSSPEEFCRSYSRHFGWKAVCVTRGAAGCALLIGDDYLEAEGYPVEVVDTVGAGDAFAAAFVHGLGAGWSTAEIADFANRVGAIVASRPGAIPKWTAEEAWALRRTAIVRGTK